MVLLVAYVVLAVGISFLCSIAEAVILSVTTSYIAALEQQGKPSGRRLKTLKSDINSPLAVILTLNTIAHTVGAAGAGAQAAMLFGNVYMGIFSGVLTLVILIFSEIIPKALGAQYWRMLAPTTAFVLSSLVRWMGPFVWLTKKITERMEHSEATLKGFSRQEFAAMAELGREEGELTQQESVVLRNVFLLGERSVNAAMTPRPVVLGFDEAATLASLREKIEAASFSRLPIYSEPEKVTGFVLRSDLLLAFMRGQDQDCLQTYARDLPAIVGEASLLQAFETMISRDAHMLLVVDEYGGMRGILTMEDIFENLLGTNIVDERDSVVSMKKLAKRLGSVRWRKMGVRSGEADFSEKTPRPPKKGGD
ncbi:CNNM domain-containing protein [Marinibactrum halimedae]|uniref:HlyC/CorC family transporter n=1 Tax=Marinibactrum halimedae TaxID=1444977 RepID=A0AA37WP22_9GAMM|nr:CNNM domain-containing protein [Marinibactrum halimedae]MCD9457590.1 CNNM domain-containing protein [Marinibactrum halimedae]GLS28010.1 hypothetical protein GCM10007877_37290 [Marinibactrum halimedae]